MAGVLCCVLLAAGKSSRLGAPKALIEVGNRTLVGWLASRLEATGARIVIVTREEIFSEVRASVGKVPVIVNEDPESGRTGTIQVGIRYFRETIEGDIRVLVVPVDRPGFSDSTLKTISSSIVSSSPSNFGRGGHPLIVCGRDVSRILSSDPDLPLNAIVKSVKVDVEDPHLHLNIDTSEDLNGLSKAIDEL
ncbi:MAG: NTP transferase domain-containing protein [Candidatus Thalassarchaeaceae archaeon]|jgi:molybdenum cofactor cytidylyltransferase|nr:hypothetical protein [Euryarchaeota archaeon]MDP6871737.1 NTP transferase domain-containing protein [Candidatus Thalassarchaeaceae archaeon]|tara:strand:+ start:1101 stop:1676 length:576 start_codon:yes stop_codon:yes gene_type:complete